MREADRVTSDTLTMTTVMAKALVMTIVIERAVPPLDQVVIRPARRSDAEPLRRMYRRCGADTRYGRFHGVLNEIPEAYLDGALGTDPDLHDALVVETAGGDVAALGSAVRVPTGQGPATVDIGLLVEDRWQRRGLGSRLLALLAARARSRGVERLRCDLLPGNRHLVPVLRRHTGTLVIRHEAGVISVEGSLR